MRNADSSSTYNRTRLTTKGVVGMMSFACLIELMTLPAWGASYTGNISLLEIWPNGNVAFKLATSVPTCNQQFVLNASQPGTKNLYAALLAAKISGKQIQVVDVGTCGPAEGYGGSYNLVAYLYPQDQ
jgi:hypothetical protein